MTPQEQFEVFDQNLLGFITTFVKKNEKKADWTLSPYQRRTIEAIFRFDHSGRLAFRTLLWSEVKKSGKTFLAAVFTLWWGLTHPSTEVLICSNDLEQAQSRVFKTVLDLLLHNASLKAFIKSQTKTTIEFLNGTIITALPSEYKSAAGPRHSLVVFDELWGYSLENATRLFEELTPPPTEENAWCCIVTTAGFTGESVLLERLYARGLAGVAIGPHDLEITQNGSLIMFWSHLARQNWHTEAYLAEQRESLRPNTYLRLWENRWVSSESKFLTAEQYDGCVDEDLVPLAFCKSIPLFVGVDAAVRSDCAGIVAVGWDTDDDKIVLAGHRLWQPAPGREISLEHDIEAALLALHKNYRLKRVLTDPWQMMGMVQKLTARGVPIEEFPATVSNCIAMGEGLFSAFKNKTLVLYRDAMLREHCLNAGAKETDRGLQIVKERQSKKVDGAIALSMAVVAALQQGRPALAPAVPMPGIVEYVSRRYVDPHPTDWVGKY